MAAGEYLPPVYAELRGDISDYLEKLAAADAAMQSFSRNLPKEFDKQTDPIGKEGAKAAEAYSGKFTETLTKSLDRAYRDLPDIPVHADSSDAEVKLAALRAELDGLRHEEIGVTIDERLVLAQIARIKAELAALGGDSSTSARIRFDAKSAADDLDKLGTTLGKSAVQTGEQIGSKVSQGFFKDLSTQIPQGLSAVMEAGFTDPVVLAALAPAVVELGVAAGGLMLTGIGLAGIGAGIAGQIHNPQVLSAASHLGADVSNGFKLATSSFAEPLAGALKGLDDEWLKLQPGLTDTFADLAPMVTTLGEGVTGFLDKLIPGLERAAVAAEPLVGTFSEWLPQAGSEFADLLDTMAAHSDELNDGLKLVLGTVSAIVKVLDYGATAGSWLFEFGKWTTGTIGALVDLGGASSGAHGELIRINKDAKDAGDAASGAVPDFDALTQQLNQTAQTADTLAGAMADKLFDALMSNDRATLGLAQAHTRLDDSLAKNGKNFDLNTKAGQTNYSALLDQIDANIKMYDTMIASGKSAEDAANAYDKNTAALEKQLRKAGLTDKQINDLIGDYKSVPDTVDSNIAIEGLTNALNNFGMLLAAINHLDGKSFGFTLNGKITLNGHTFNYGDASTFFHGLAVGGPTDAGRAYMVGEEGPELWMESRPGYMIPNDQLRDLARSAVGGSDGAAMPGLGAIMSGLSRAPIPGPVSVGGGSDRPIVVQSNVYLDGRQIQQSMIQAAQRDKFRTGSTGLT